MILEGASGLFFLPIPPTDPPDPPCVKLRLRKEDDPRSGVRIVFSCYSTDRIHRVWSFDWEKKRSLPFFQPITPTWWWGDETFDMRYLLQTSSPWTPSTPFKVSNLYPLTRFIFNILPCSFERFLSYLKQIQMFLC
jgi:hypothetical protein